MNSTPPTGLISVLAPSSSLTPHHSCSRSASLFLSHSMDFLSSCCFSSTRYYSNPTCCSFHSFVFLRLASASSRLLSLRVSVPLFLFRKRRSNSEPLGNPRVSKQLGRRFFCFWKTERKSRPSILVRQISGRGISVKARQHNIESWPPLS